MKQVSLRSILTVVLLCGVIAAGWFFLGTTHGRYLLANPHLIGRDVAKWTQGHWVIAPLIFIGVYVVLAILAVPVWWLQILGGYGFGLVRGVLWAEVGAAIGAIVTLRLSRYLIGEWFASRVESRRERIHRISEKLGHNGLLVVMAVRLAHVIPFGISNYVFGLFRISMIDAGLGTLLGGAPAITVYVTLGADRRLLESWRYWVVVVAVNLVLMVPLLLRYRRPEWFKKIGVE